MPCDAEDAARRSRGAATRIVVSETLMKPMARTILGSAIAGAVVMITLSGCAMTAPARDALPGAHAPAFSITDGADRARRWGDAFGDDRLNAEIERGLAGNFSLRAAHERVEAARAVARRVDAGRAVTLDATAAAAVRDGDDVAQRTELSVDLTAAYEVDLWDRLAARQDAAALDALATAEDYQAAALTLSAEMARALYRRAEAAAQLELIDAQLATNRRVLEVIESRFSIGESGSADVLRQRQLVEATAEQRLAVQITRDVLDHQRAVLRGDAPQGALEPTATHALPDVPALPAIGVPAALLQRRPDVRAVFLRLEAADASVAAAVADQYPALDLSASLRSAAENPSGLFSGWLASLAAQLVAPIVDGGARRAEVDRSVAVRRERLAQYGDTVLRAFQDVEDALADEQYQRARIVSLGAQLELARATYRELRGQYLNGAADFIDVLVALREEQALERSVLEARRLEIEARIALHRAIAGGVVEPEHDGVTERTPDDQRKEPRES